MLLEYYVKISRISKFRNLFQNFKTFSRFFRVFSSLLRKRKEGFVDEKQNSHFSPLNFINLREIRRKTHGNASIYKISQ